MQPPFYWWRKWLTNLNLGVFARKVNIYILRTGIVGIVNVVTLYFTGHYLGPRPMGLIGFATSFIQMFFMFSDLGLGQAHIKRISEGKNVSYCTGTYLIIKSTLILILFVALTAYLLLKKFYFQTQFNDPDQERIIYLLLIPVVLVQLSNIPLHTFEARTESVKASLPLVISSLIKAPLIVSVAVFGLGVYGLVFARYVSGLVIFLIAYKLLKDPIKLPPKGYFKSYFVFAYKVFFITILTQAALQIDKLLIGKYVSIEAVGVYVSALSIIAVLNVIPNAVGSLLFPTISRADSAGNLDLIKNYTLLSEKYIGMTVIPVAIIIFFFSKSIIFLLVGPEFSDAQIPLSILSFYFLINGLRKPYASLIAGTDKMSLLALISTISVSVNILLNLLLIPGNLYGISLGGLGIKGAAIATLTSGIVYSLLCRIVVFRATGIKSNKSVFIQYFAAIIMALSLWLLNRILPVDNMKQLKMLFALCFYSAVGMFIFIIVLVAFKEFTMKELALIKKSISPAKMKEYFKKEIKE